MVKDPLVAEEVLFYGGEAGGGGIVGGPERVNVICVGEGGGGVWACADG